MRSPFGPFGHHDPRIGFGFGGGRFGRFPEHGHIPHHGDIPHHGHVGEHGGFAGHGHVPEARFDPRMGFPGPGGFPPPPWGGERGFRGRGFRGFPGGGHGGHGGRGRRRHRRGDVRTAVLRLLTERPMHGYEIIQEIAERSDGLWRPSPGSVYPTLQLLADEDLVSTSEEPGGKKLFTLTDAGRAQAEQLGDTPPWERLAADVEPTEVALRTAYGHLSTAIFQVSWAADGEQKAKAIEVLDGARRQLYAILAEAGADVSNDIGEPDEDDEE
jgi:DNA-binding PadR family transcriptional regulator